MRFLSIRSNVNPGWLQCSVFKSFNPLPATVTSTLVPARPPAGKTEFRTGLGWATAGAENTTATTNTSAAKGNAVKHFETEKFSEKLRTHPPAPVLRRAFAASEEEFWNRSKMKLTPHNQQDFLVDTAFVQIRDFASYFALNLASITSHQSMLMSG